MKQAFCGRADIARALASGDPQTVAALAEMLGFVYQPPPPPDHGKPISGESTKNIVETPPTLLEPAHKPPVPVPFWRVEGFAARDDEEVVKTEPAPLSLTEIKFGSSDQPTKYPLNTWPALAPRLRKPCTALREGHVVDTKRIIGCLSRGRFLPRLPRLQRRRWGEHIQIIVDRSEHLVPYWDDQLNVCVQVERLFPKQNIEYVSFWEGLDAPLPSGADEERLYQLPPPGSLVLALSDLGALLPTGRRERTFWQRLGQRLSAQGCRPVALLPSALCLSFGHALRWPLLSWSGRLEAKPQTGSFAKDAEWLLSMVSPAVRIEPGFLRAVRLLLDMDAGVESLVWQHPAVVSTSCVAATLNPNDAKRLRAEFERQPRKRREAVLALLRQWRSHLPREIWFEEVRSLDPASQALLPQSDLNASRYFFYDLGRRTTAGEAVGGVRDWFMRAEARFTDGAWSDPQLKHALHRLWWSVHRDDPDPKPPPGYDPAYVDARGTMARRIAFQQHVGELTFKALPGEWDDVPASSPLGALRSRNGQIVVEPMVEREVNRAGFWKSGSPPRWASDWGWDEYGAWVEFTLERADADPVVQRMRWIQPGSFQMGSPDDEPGRWEDEGPQHEVTLSRGFWLFDTACTQALWQAVMGGNPSQFEGPDQPVEQVSWQDAQRFIQTINESLPGLALQLPTEAQWEYACRAGTTTPFSFGGNITTDQVNYDGNYPYAGGRKGDDRQETVPVKSLPPNPWGLYSMHGNVREWCLDGMRGYNEASKTDPLGPTDEGAKRVIRGGSWINDARDVRSAFRFAFEPGLRDYSLGFRCARVQGEQGEGAEPADPPAGRVAEQRLAADRSSGAAWVHLQSGDDRGACPFPQAGNIIIRSDSDRLVLRRFTQPTWASAIGRDRYGLWTEFEVERSGQRPVKQRMRWIAPGRFLMGSPESEAGRYENEGPRHEVVISQGFWLFDTPCAQALWEAVMENNPSRFASPKRPVEKVSWDDAQAFIEAMNHRLPGVELSLPSEAQWEYACRAGTETATYTGDLKILGEHNAPLLDEIAWYGGNSGVEFDLDGGSDSSGWTEKQYPHTRAGTREVGLKLPNPWGLYDMLGNVWEWCHDGMRDYNESSENDPLGPPTDEGAERVVRGGSWDSSARDVRSACRGADEPGYRDSNLGFRCARVQREPGGSAGAERRSRLGAGRADRSAAKRRGKQ